METYSAVQEKVVVITGASSGIGRTAALRFAREGFHVAVASRDKQALRSLAHELSALGPEALDVATDVTDPEAVRKLALLTIGRFGKIDVWINAAAVSLFARFEDSPWEDYRRVIETNLFGTLYGSREALKQFHRQGRGVLINVSSVVGKISQPFTSAYVLSKWAIQGFSESLRQELLEWPGIRVCSVLPGSTDTPLFQHAANYMGRKVKPVQPVDTPERVADILYRCALSPKREIVIGARRKVWVWGHFLLPALFEHLSRRRTEGEHFAPQLADPTTGNLYAPISNTNSLTGGWKQAA